MSVDSPYFNGIDREGRPIRINLSREARQEAG